VNAVEDRVNRQLVPTLLIACAACGGGGSASAPAPSDPSATLAVFMDAVQRKDLAEMGRVWGTAQGSAAGRMRREELQQRLEVIQIYLNHESYRVVGPAPLAPGSNAARAYQIEITRRNRCRASFPIELVQTSKGEWLVQNVNLDQAGNPARPCG